MSRSRVPYLGRVPLSCDSLAVVDVWRGKEEGWLSPFCKMPGGFSEGPRPSGFAL